jgi:hypothetical protein
MSMPRIEREMENPPSPKALWRTGGRGGVLAKVRREGIKVNETGKPGARKCAYERISALKSGFWKIRGEAAPSWSGIIFTTGDVPLLTSGATIGLARHSPFYGILRLFTPFGGRRILGSVRGFILCAEARRKGFGGAAGPPLPAFVRLCPPLPAFLFRRRQKHYGGQGGGSFWQFASGAQGSRTAYLESKCTASYRLISPGTAWRFRRREDAMADKGRGGKDAARHCDPAGRDFCGHEPQRWAL